MGNKIVTEPASKLREIARKALEGNWKKMFAGVVIYFVMLSGIMTVLDYFFHTVRYVMTPYGEYLGVSVGYASLMYELAVTGALMYGLSAFMLAFFRRKKTDCTVIFDGFGLFGKTLILYLLYWIKVTLWTMLFVIPGIIASFRYSQAFYLQVDHPDWKASQCINESKALMMGNKGTLFILNLSFIGWYVLAMLLSTSVDLIFPEMGFIGIVIWMVTMLPVLVVDLYRFMAQTAFYEILTGNLVVLGEPGGGEF